MTLDVLNSGLVTGDYSPYPFWEKSGPPKKFGGQGGKALDRAANLILSTIVLSQRATRIIRKEAGYIGGVTHAEFNLDMDSFKRACFTRGDMSAIIVDPDSLLVLVDPNTGRIVSEEKYDKILGPFDRKIKNFRQSVDYQMAYETTVDKERMERRFFRTEKLPEITITRIAKRLGIAGGIPIFDMEGNMLWPRQMNKEEVLEYIKQRKVKREENE